MKRQILENAMAAAGSSSHCVIPLDGTVNEPPAHKISLRTTEIYFIRFPLKDVLLTSCVPILTALFTTSGEVYF
jgi:hypothetical protein